MSRYDRMTASESDQRSSGQRDRDRVLYSDGLRRLAGVTQVVAASEGEVVHNRLTHTLKVAQIARRLAERLAADSPELADAHGGFDPDVVETAALSHDLGHPPFGHIAEEELDELLERRGCRDGYEGNAQAFRVVAKLERRRRGELGLNLCRASLNALLKYPWRRQTSGKRSRKWGAYSSEEVEFDFARGRDVDAPQDERQSLEAAVMDWADDIAYSLHDTEDFYRAGLIPLHELQADVEAQGERRRFFDDTFNRWKELKGKEVEPDERRRLEEAFGTFVDFLPVMERYEETSDQLAALKSAVAGRIAAYIRNQTKINGDVALDNRLLIPQETLDEVRMLKELTWHYVIKHPSLAAQQYGQRRIIKSLFEAFADAAEVGSRERHILPRMAQLELEGMDANSDKDARLRIAADAVAALSDQQAVRLYHRLHGVSFGSVFDPIVR